MNKGRAGIAAAIGAGVAGVALAASASAQGFGASRDWRTGATITSSEVSPCEKLSGNKREDCMAQIRRDDAQRGVNSRSASREGGAAGPGASRTRERSTVPNGSYR